MPQITNPRVIDSHAAVGKVAPSSSRHPFLTPENSARAHAAPPDAENTCGTVDTGFRKPSTAVWHPTTPRRGRSPHLPRKSDAAAQRYRRRQLRCPSSNNPSGPTSSSLTRADRDEMTYITGARVITNHAAMGRSTPAATDRTYLRDLVRARDDVRGDLMSARHRVSKLLLRQGIIYSGGKPWTGKHEAWLRTHTLRHPGPANGL